VSQSRLGVHINVETSPPMPALRLTKLSPADKSAGSLLRSENGPLALFSGAPPRAPKAAVLLVAHPARIIALNYPQDLRDGPLVCVEP
jgi:hypothetical protein